MKNSGKPLIIPIFIPHFGCSHQCAFCNQSIITNQKSSLPDEKMIHGIVDQYLKYQGKRQVVEVAFFGGNFLGLPHDLIIKFLDIIQPLIKNKKIDGIRFSTRPDTITSNTIELIAPYEIRAIELGVQSMNDEVLKASKRGHTSFDTIQAIKLLKQIEVSIGVQVMLGLVSDTERSLLKSTQCIADLSPDFARIYPLLVLEGSQYASWYRKGIYHSLDLDQSIGLAAKMVTIFDKASIDVVRLGLQASEMMEDPEQVIAGPWHPAFGHLVFSKILYDKTCVKIDGYIKKYDQQEIILCCHSKTESQLRGNKNENYKKLIEKYSRINPKLHLDDRISEGRVELKSIVRKI